MIVCQILANTPHISQTGKKLPLDIYFSLDKNIGFNFKPDGNSIME